MTKKTTESKKFANVAKQIDTGRTIRDVQFLSDQFVTKRKTEMFKRVKGSTIVKLIGGNKSTESIYNLVDEYNGDSASVTGGDNRQDQSVASYKTGMTDMTTKTTVTTMSAITYATEMLGNLADIDFIILDLREGNDYDTYHIREAISFPGPNISRDKFSAQLVMMVR